MNAKTSPAEAGLIRAIEPADEDALADLFASIDTAYFHPHPMTREEARRIAGYAGRDIYLVAFDGEQAVAYGMLRGWDEGYEVPSLGVAVLSDAQHHGWGWAMMLELHREAKERGATSIRLRVHPDNARAIRLYERMGYVDVGEERGERLMLKDGLG